MLTLENEAQRVFSIKSSIHKKEEIGVG